MTNEETHDLKACILVILADLKMWDRVKDSPFALRSLEDFKVHCSSNLPMKLEQCRTDQIPAVLDIGQGL